MSTPDSDRIVFPPMDELLFAILNERWKARGPKLRAPRKNPYGHAFQQQEDGRFAEGVAKRKDEAAARKAECLSNKPGVLP